MTSNVLSRENNKIAERRYQKTQQGICNTKKQLKVKINEFKEKLSKEESIVVQIYATFDSTDPAPPRKSDPEPCMILISSSDTYYASIMAVQKIFKQKRHE